MSAAEAARTALGSLCPVRIAYRAAAPHVDRLAGIWREIVDVRDALRSMGEAWSDEADETGHDA